jgi:hypothetical protein
MNYNRFFTYHDCKIDLHDMRSDKIGDVTVVATKKNIFFKEGDKVTVPLYQNHIHGRMFGVAPVRDFMNYFGAENDFLDFLFDMWNEHVPMECKYESD